MRRCRQRKKKRPPRRPPRQVRTVLFHLGSTRRLGSPTQRSSAFPQLRTASLPRVAVGPMDFFQITDWPCLSAKTVMPTHEHIHATDPCYFQTTPSHHQMEILLSVKNTCFRATWGWLLLVALRQAKAIKKITNRCQTKKLPTSSNYPSHSLEKPL